MPLVMLYEERSTMIGLFCPKLPIAFEQHFSCAPSPKLALLQRSVKINVA
jgi:hypothetical protein